MSEASRIPTPREIGLAILEFKRSKARKRKNPARAFGKCKLVVDHEPASKKRPHVRKYNRNDDSI